MSSFTDWATANGVTVTASNPAFGVIAGASWARSDRNEMVFYKADGVSLVTQTWSPHIQNYMATGMLLGRTSAGSGVVEEVAFSSVVPEASVLTSPLSGVSTIGFAADRAYFVYVGQLTTARTPKHVEIHVQTAGSGAQTAEVGLFSSPAAPNKASQSLTKLVSTGTVDDLTTTGIKRNTSAFATSIPAGTHLWAGIRTNMATSQPTLAALGRDWLQGRILETSTAGALTGAGPWTGAIVALVGPGIGAGPELRVVFD